MEILYTKPIVASSSNQGFLTSVRYTDATTRRQCPVQLYDQWPPLYDPHWASEETNQELTEADENTYVRGRVNTQGDGYVYHTKAAEQFDEHNSILDDASVQVYQRKWSCTNG